MKKLLFLSLFLIFGLLPYITQAIEAPVLNSVSPEILSNFYKVSDVVTISGQNLL